MAINDSILYYTVVIPYSDQPTEWHPTARHGPFSRLQRGAFKTSEQASQWAINHLKGQPYEVKPIPPAVGTVYEQVVFMQDHEAEEALRILDEQGEYAAVKYLAQWHFPGEHMTSEEPSRGAADDYFEDDHGYVLTWNTGLGYIGLEYTID